MSVNISNYDKRIAQTSFEKQMEKYQNAEILSYKDRIAQLKKIENFLLDDKKVVGLLEALKLDLGKSESECYATEIGIVLFNLRHIKSNLRRWMANKSAKTGLPLAGTKSYIKYEPKGVSLIIAPWNYPFNLCITPLLYSIAAGNRNILKPSEMAPNTSAFIQKMCTELFKEDYVKVVEGNVEASQHLLSLPFHHIFFTGSPNIGKIVMRSAADHLASVVLELGGKSPAIFEPKANFKKLVPRLVWGKCINAGQTCIAPDYLVVHKDDKDKIVEAFKLNVKKLYGDTENMSSSGDYCKIINQKHFDRIVHLLEDAVGKGAKVLSGGKHDKSKLFIEPTLLDNINPSMEIYSEEIFGPLMPITTYQNTNDIINKVNQGEKPLTLYICGSSNKFQKEIMDSTSSGGVVVNDFLLGYSNPDLAFGGINNSGMGRSLGQPGFEGFSNPKSVVKRNFLDFTMIYPPYTNRVNSLIKLIMKKL